MQHVGGGHEPCLGALVPESVGLLHGQQRLDSRVHRRLVGAIAQSFQGNQGQGRGGGIGLAVGFPTRAFGERLSGIEPPGPVRILDGPQPLLILGHLALNPLPQVPGVGFRQEPVVGEFGGRQVLLGRAGRRFGLNPGRRRRKSLLYRMGFDADLEVVPGKEATEELDAVGEVVAVFRLHLQQLQSLFFHGREVAGMASAVPGGAEDLSGKAENHRLAHVGAGPGGIDPAGIGGLQHLVGRSQQLLRMELARRKHPLGGAKIVAGHPGSGGTVADVQGSQAGIVGGLLEIVGRPQRLIHHVDQPAEILDVFDPVSVLHGNRRAPNAGLGVAAHAMGPQQVAGVADAALHAGAARAVGQPGVHLGQVVVEALAHRQPGIPVGRRLEQPQFDLVARRIGLGPQEVDSPGLQQAVDFRSVILGLLVNPLIVVAPPGVLHQRQQRHFPGSRFRRIPGGFGRGRPGLAGCGRQRVEPQAGRQGVIGQRQVAGQKPGLRPGVFDPKPVVSGTPDPAVVEVLDVIGPGGHQNPLHAFTFGKRNGLGLLGSIVGFLLHVEMKVRRTLEIQGSDPGEQGNPRPGGPGRVAGKGGHLGCGPGFPPAGSAEDRDFIDDRSQAQDIPSRHRSSVNHKHIRIQGMEHFSPAGGGPIVNAKGIGFPPVPAGTGSLPGGAGALGPIATFQLPTHRHPAVGRQGGGQGDRHRNLPDFAATQVEGPFPPAVGVKGNLDPAGARPGGDPARTTGKNTQERQNGRQPQGSGLPDDSRPGHCWFPWF